MDKVTQVVIEMIKAFDYFTKYFLETSSMDMLCMLQVEMMNISQLW